MSTISLMLDLDAFQAKPAECFSAVEKLLMACCTMQPEDGALPRGDAEGDGEVYHKNDEVPMLKTLFFLTNAAAK